MPPAARPLVALDTQIIIRALHTRRGSTAELMQALVDCAYHLLTSEPLLEDLRRGLGRPAVQRLGRRSIGRLDLEEAIAATRAMAFRVLPGDYQDLDLVSTDPNNNPVVACALEGGADYIVTDDGRDLLPLKVIRVAGYEPIQIPPPGPFLRHVLHRR